MEKVWLNHEYEESFLRIFTQNFIFYAWVRRNKAVYDLIVQWNALFLNKKYLIGKKLLVNGYGNWSQRIN